MTLINSGTRNLADRQIKKAFAAETPWEISSAFYIAMHTSQRMHLLVINDCS